MIPLTLVLKALDVSAELLRAFSGLPVETRTRIVKDILDDKEKREAWLARIAATISGWWAGIEN